MDAEKLEWIESSMEEIKKTIWEMDWEKQFGSLPKNSFQGERNPCNHALLYLSWLLTDWSDCKGSFTQRQLAELLKEVADAILEYTTGVKSD